MPFDVDVSLTIIAVCAMVHAAMLLFGAVRR